MHQKIGNSNLKFFQFAKLVFCVHVAENGQKSALFSVSKRIDEKLSMLAKI